MATIYFLILVGVVAGCGFAWEVYSDKQSERRTKTRWHTIQFPSCRRGGEGIRNYFLQIFGSFNHSSYLCSRLRLQSSEI